MTTIGEDFKLTSEYTALHELGYVVSSSGGSSHVEVRRADGTVIDKYLSIKAAYSDLVGIPTGKSPETVIEERLGGGGTDVNGHVLRFGYAIAKNWNANLTYFINEAGENAGNMHDYDRFQLDLGFKY